MAKDDSGAGEPYRYVNDALYERLTALDSMWKNSGEPPARELGEACARLIKREARLLDDGEFERWLELFSRECIYWIPVRRGNDPRREITGEFHDRRRLKDRIARLRTGSAYSQIPPTRTCHLLSNFEIFTSRADEVAARANFVIQTYRLGVHRALAGWCGYLFVPEQDAWKIALKQINLIDCDEGQENNSFFLCRQPGGSIAPGSEALFARGGETWLNRMKSGRRAYRVQDSSNVTDFGRRRKASGRAPCATRSNATA